MNTPLGLYIHVPFCARECDYCAFYKEKADRTKIDLYLNTIEEELQRFPLQKTPWAKEPRLWLASGEDDPHERGGVQRGKAPVNSSPSLGRGQGGGDEVTVFMGGGTPTLLSADDLDRLCGAIRAAAGGNISEWTIECAPATLKKDKIDILKKHGVNRYSLGVQSFNPKTLEAIGRPHSLKQIEEAIALLQDAVKDGAWGRPRAGQGAQPPYNIPLPEGGARGGCSWNMDLIFAAAESTLADWLTDLEKAVSLGSQHLSTYCLTFESDTEFFLKMRRGAKKKPTPQEEARFYKKTWEVLRGAGLHHYELANFSRAGRECRHNLNTWKMGEWVGYGPSVASQNSLKRYTNIPELDAWAAGVRSGKRGLVDEKILTTHDLAIDAIVFGLRMPDGIDIGDIQKRFGKLDAGKLQKLGGALSNEGYLVIKRDIWKLTDDGLLVADRIGGEVIERLEYHD